MDRSEIFYVTNRRETVFNCVQAGLGVLPAIQLDNVSSQARRQLVRHARPVGCLVLSLALVAGPASAQQRSQHPLADSASAAAAQAAATTPAQPPRRPMFLTGIVLGLAGGTAIILGSTVAKTEDSTSGNTPDSGFDSCESLQSNPVYRRKPVQSPEGSQHGARDWRRDRGRRRRRAGDHRRAAQQRDVRARHGALPASRRRFD